MIQGGQHLIGKRQKVIIIIDDLGGHHIVLCEGVTGSSIGSDVRFYTLTAILQQAVSLGRIRLNGTYTSSPIAMSNSGVTVDIAEG